MASFAILNLRVAAELGGYPSSSIRWVVHLTPISERVFELAKEDWRSGKDASLLSAQEKSLPNPSQSFRRIGVRYKEIRAILDSELTSGSLHR